MARSAMSILEQTARKRIAAVKKILGAKADDAAIEKSVYACMAHQERDKRAADIRKRPTNKREKGAIDKVAKAARRLANALRDEALPSFVLRRFPDLQKLDKTVAELERLVLIKLVPKRSAGSKDQAALLAAALLQEHGFVKPVITRKKTFHRLAGALNGGGDLFDQIRKYRGQQVTFVDDEDED